MYGVGKAGACGSFQAEQRTCAKGLRQEELRITEEVKEGCCD